MSLEENKQLVLRWKEELWGRRNLNVVDELCGPDYVGRIGGVPGPVQGREALKQLIAAYFAAFEVDDTPEFLVAEGDMVVIHDTYRFKHKGEFQGKLEGSRTASAVEAGQVVGVVVANGSLSTWTELLPRHVTCRLWKLDG